MDSETINENCPRPWKETHASEFLAHLEAIQWPFRGLVIDQHIPQCHNNIAIFWFFDKVSNHWYQGSIKIKYLKIHVVVVWGGGNLYNLNEMEREMKFYKTMKKIFFQLIQYLRKVCERWIDRGWRFGGPRNSSAWAVENWIKGGWPLYVATFDSIFTDRSVHSRHPP